MTQIDPYDRVAFEQFCADLVAKGFNPKPKSRNHWVGPIHQSLKPFTDAEFMEVHFREGWPLRYAYVIVDGLRTRHAGNGIICLWAEDDPAQLAGSTVAGLLARIDEWAGAASDGFDIANEALDSFMLYEHQNGYVLELPLADFTDKSSGYITRLAARRRGGAIQVVTGRDEAELRGVLYLHRDIGMPPANYRKFRRLLNTRQREDLDRGLADRAPAALNEPSGGYDFVVLAWPRFDHHDVLALGFEGASNTLRASAFTPSPSDLVSRSRRAGPDFSVLNDKKVLVAGLGSIGGAAALALAECGVGHIRGHDSDMLKTANVVRHVSSDAAVGYSKSSALSVEVQGHAPWCTFDARPEDLSLDPTHLTEQIEGFDLVIDCTGLFSLTAALSEICHKGSISFITVALYHQGSILRIRRQAAGDAAIAARTASSSHVQIPPEASPLAHTGFLEIGCTAYVNNAPPWASHRAAADTAATAVDFLAGRFDLDADQVVVLRPFGSAPFDRVGPVRDDNK